MYDHMSSNLDDGEDYSVDEMDVDVERFERESSVETPSERSVLTPDESFPSRMRLGNSGLENGRPLGLKIQELEEEAAMLRMDLDDSRVVVPPSPGPVLEASLATWQDFRFDRYSLIVDSSPSDGMQSSPELDTDESFSPIETATPISFQQPPSRPSLISIVSISQQGRPRAKPSLPSPLSPATPSMSGSGLRVKKRSSTSSSHSAFPAAEATLFEVPDLPAHAFERIANASQESLPLSILSSSVRELKSSSRAERKSSVPRLSAALNHARVSSIKSFIKTPTSATHSRSFSRPSSHTSRPSTSSIISSGEAFPLMKNAAFSTSSGNIASVQRQPTSLSISSSTSHASYGGHSSSNNNAMTALPSLPTPPAEDDDNDHDHDHASDPLASQRSMQRKKSFSALRRRSESIGHALKGLGKMTTKAQEPSHVVTPAMPTPRRSAFPQELSRFSQPPLPLPSPPSVSSIASSWNTTMRNISSSSGGNIGLGLRSVDGFSGR